MSFNLPQQFVWLSKLVYIACTKSPSCGIFQICFDLITCSSVISTGLETQISYVVSVSFLAVHYIVIDISQSEICTTCILTWSYSLQFKLLHGSWPNGLNSHNRFLYLCNCHCPETILIALPALQRGVDGAESLFEFSIKKLLKFSWVFRELVTMLQHVINNIKGVRDIWIRVQKFKS